MKYIAFFVIFLSFWCSESALGQVIDYGSSTAAEGAARGWANILQAQGERNLSNSQAAINVQDAYSKAIDNHMSAVNAYYAKKDIYRQQRQQEEYEKESRRLARRARNELPPLTAEEFDRTTGRIAWPGPLEQSQYNEYRQMLDANFQRRAETGALSGNEYMEAKNASKAWRTMLISQKDVYSPEMLHQFVRFLLRLERELDDNLS
jgi:hypothetical protein